MINFIKISLTTQTVTLMDQHLHRCHSPELDSQLLLKSVLWFILEILRLEIFGCHKVKSVVKLLSRSNHFVDINNENYKWKNYDEKIL